MMRGLTLLTVLLLLTGCANTPDTGNDPRGGGFIGGLTGITRGDYDERLRQREESLARQAEMRAMLNQDRGELESTKLTKTEQVAEQRRKLKSLDLRLAKLSSEVKTLSAAGASEKEIAAMRQRIAGLQGKIRRLQEENRQGQLRRKQFEKQNAELEKQLALLVDLVTQYSK